MHLVMKTVSTQSYPSEADGNAEPESESITPRHTGTGTPVAAETERITCRVDTEGVRQNVTVCGEQGLNPIMVDAIGGDIAPASSTERSTSTRG